jgi:hypothetical protein
MLNVSEGFPEAGEELLPIASLLKGTIKPQ